MSSVDFTDFNPGDIGEFVSGIGEGIESIARDWWTKNLEDGSGYLEAVAKAVTQTQIALAAGRITEAHAKIYMRSHRRAIRSYFSRLEYQTLSLMQSVLDLVSDAFGWAIFNGTGISVAPRFRN